MLFYKIEAIKVNDSEQKELSRQEHRARANEIAEKSEGFFQKCDQNQMIFMVGIQDEKVTCGAICKGKENINELFAKYAKLLPFDIESFRIEEITFSALQSLLTSSRRNDYIMDDDDVLTAFEISNLAPRYSDVDFGEAMINIKKERAEITEIADNLLFSGTMLPEIERIYQSKTSKTAEGHPVHYIVQTDDREVRKSVYKNLLSALYVNLLKITTDGRKAALDMRLIDMVYGLDVDSKVYRCAENIMNIYENTRGEKLIQMVFCDSSTPKQSFNLYDELKSILVAMGIPAHQIAFIHEADSEDKKNMLFYDLRKGDVSVVIGSTFKMGLGVNVQEKLCALHHLDVPWRPADMVQREGRILRQGKKNRL